MAELVGVIASGISIGTLVAQITSSLIKLKSYWDQLPDAPRDIKDLIDELELITSLIADMEDDQRRNPLSSTILTSSPNSISKCLQSCKQGADSLRDLTHSIHADLEASGRRRKKWGSVKVILKRDRIDKYQTKLERAIRLLSLSHQMYTRYVFTFLRDTFAGIRGRQATLRTVQLK